MLTIATFRCTYSFNDKYFSSFPKDVIRRAQWGEFCEISIDEIKPSFRLCNIHFTEDDFQNWSTKNILTRNSVPTQFPKYSFEERLECVEEIEEIDSTAPTLYDVEGMFDSTLAKVPLSTIVVLSNVLNVMYLVSIVCYSGLPT